MLQRTENPLLRYLFIYFVFASNIASIFAWQNSVVNIYSHRHYDVDKQLFRKFTQETGIKVNVVKANADQLIKRLEIEGKNSPADILITVDAGRLHRAKEKRLLQPIRSEVLEKNIPVHLRDHEGYWFALTIRARVIVYAKDRVQPQELSTYEALTDEKWRGKILVRSSQNIYNQSLLASIITTVGPKKAKVWAKGITANFARRPKGNDRDQIKAIAAGIGDVALVNSYYLGKLLSSKDANDRKAAQAVKVFFPNQNDRGTHINISGIGVTASSKNKENAIKLIEFLSSPEAQKLFAEANFEYPVSPNVEKCSLVQSWGDFKSAKIDLTQLGKHNYEAVKIFDEVGWR